MARSLARKMMSPHDTSRSPIAPRQYRRLHRLFATLFTKSGSGGKNASNQNHATERVLSDRWAQLINLKDESRGSAIAANVIELYDSLEDDAKAVFLAQLSEDIHNASNRMLEVAKDFVADPGSDRLLALSEQIGKMGGQFLSRLNQAAGGTTALVRMRSDLLKLRDRIPYAEILDHAFSAMFHAWFNSGFLDLKRIDWSDSAETLEKIIQYEAVHAIGGWDGLKDRVQPRDRMLFGFFHHRFGSDPLIFTEVALMRAMPGTIDAILGQRTPIDPREANTAVFYSISNCHPGLKGIPLGNLLIKQIVAELHEQYPRIETFATLSPVPGLSAWLKREIESGDLPLPTGFASMEELTSAVVHVGDNLGDTPELNAYLEAAAAIYLSCAKNREDLPLDPVARFHLGNGARLEQVQVNADRSTKGIAQSLGVMVNYLYVESDVDSIIQALTENGTVAMSDSVREFLRNGEIIFGQCKSECAETHPTIAGAA
jgi:malonyl-CoA decarboxylase